MPMVKPLKHYVFREIGGIFRDIENREQEILADVLTEYELLIDDRMEFARIRDYAREIIIWYRAYGNVVDITIWKMD